jgi:hypothetical protein
VAVNGTPHIKIKKKNVDHKRRAETSAATRSSYRRTLIVSEGGAGG